MAQLNTRRYEVVAGAFVLAMIAVAAMILFTVTKSEGWSGRGRDVDVAFPLDSGIRGLAVGAPVHVGGYSVGSVVGIRPDFAGNGEPAVPSIVLTLRVPADLPLRRNADIIISGGLLGGGGVVNIRALGTGPTPAAGEVIRGTPTAGPLVEDAAAGAGIGEPQRGNIRELLANLAEVTGQIRRQLADDGDVKIALAAVRRMTAKDGDLSAALANTRKFTESVAGHTDDLAGRVKGTLTKLDRAVDQLQAVIAKVDAGLDPVLAKAKAAVEQIDALLAENRPDVRAAVKSVRKTAESAEAGVGAVFADAKDITAAVKKAMGSLQANLENLERLTGAGRELAVLNKDAIDDTLRNFKEASSQLKLASREIRRAPWRLLYNPDEQERDSLNLLDAVRLFNEGAGRLEDSVKRLSALTAEGKVAPDDPRIRQTIEELRARLNALQKAEKALFDTIK
jgi:ABC-type transporter Mla subunit MlaD